MKNNANIRSAHPATIAYAKRHGLDADTFKSQGRLTVRFDDRYRVNMQPGAGGRIAVTARLLDLTSLGQRREDALMQLSTLATGTYRDHACGLCIDPSDASLQLQLLLEADTDVDGLQTAVEDFLNMLEFWTRTCTRISSSFSARVL